GDPLSLGNRQVSGADPGQAVARGLRAVGSPVDRPILGSRSPLALGSPAVPGAVVPAAPGPVGAPRLAAARPLAGIAVGAGEADPGAAALAAAGPEARAVQGGRGRVRGAEVAAAVVVGSRGCELSASRSVMLTPDEGN